MKRSQTDRLLDAVHERVGSAESGEGLTINTWDEHGRVEVRWCRSYDGVLSDERVIVADCLTAALRAVLDYEDEADEIDAKEER
jgi:hypothetical protein